MDNGGQYRKEWLLLVDTQRKKSDDCYLICKDYRTRKAVTNGDIALLGYDVLAYKPVEPSIELLREAALFIDKPITTTIEGKQVSINIERKEKKE